MSKLYGKYKIEKTDGTMVDPEAQYFVLRIDTDPIARMALGAYANLLEIEDPEFAKELKAWIHRYE